MGELRFPLVTDHLLIQPDHEDQLWNGDWSVRLKEGSQEKIGRLTFAGAKIPGEVPVHVELEPEFQNRGYGSEIFYFMARFVFRFRDLREISAVCEHTNDRCIHALNKAGYVFREYKDGRDHYSRKRQKTAWAGLYLALGVCAGLILGIVFQNLWVGTVTGILVWTLLGFFLDDREKRSHQPDGQFRGQQ